MCQRQVPYLLISFKSLWSYVDLSSTCFGSSFAASATRTLSLCLTPALVTTGPFTLLQLFRTCTLLAISVRLPAWLLMLTPGWVNHNILWSHWVGIRLDFTPLFSLIALTLVVAKVKAFQGTSTRELASCPGFYGWTKIWSLNSADTRCCTCLVDHKQLIL